MLYFIPAWYQANHWRENEQHWYIRRMRTEFDDTVKQIQLFHRNGAHPYQIVLLSHAPNFRHFLHRQGIYHAPYWSCFDSIQCIRRKKIRMFSFRNIRWPEHTEFAYSPFATLAYVDGVKYAQIEFGEDGNPIQIDMYHADWIIRRNLYDDRGFVSSTTIYERGKPVYCDYLTQEGKWNIREFIGDGHIEVNPQVGAFLLTIDGEEKMQKFRKQRYATMGEVILEVLTAYIEHTDSEDIFCSAMHDLHWRVLDQALQGRKRVVTFFENRFPWEKLPDMKEYLEKSNYIITDSQRITRQILERTGELQTRIRDITPYDTRRDYGISQQLSVQKILVPVDGMDDRFFYEITKELAQYVEKNDKAMIHYFTRNNDYDQKNKIITKAQEVLRLEGYDIRLAGEETDRQVSENRIDEEEEEEIKVRFFVEQCVDELTTSKCLREQRVIVDLRDKLSLYLQISGISMGIPQIVRYETQYVQHEKNGYVLQELEQLQEVLDYYLQELNHWNHAMVAAFEIGENYTTAKLVEQWKEVIDIIGKD